MDEITVVVTACNRPDLLEKTLDSFFAMTNFAGPMIVIEDSGDLSKNKHLESKYASQGHSINFIYNSSRLGQIKSIDRAQDLVKTKYIFHLEDDWLFYDKGFLEESVDILERWPKVSAVMCRKEGDGHQYHSKEIPYLECRGRGFRHWGFYSFNPGLRRKQDVIDTVGTFQKVATFNTKQSVKSEEVINDIFRKAGFRMALTSKGYAKHLGDGRHVGHNLQASQCTIV